MENICSFLSLGIKWTALHGACFKCLCSIPLKLSRLFSDQSAATNHSSDLFDGSWGHQIQVVVQVCCVVYRWCVVVVLYFRDRWHLKTQSLGVLTTMKKMKTSLIRRLWVIYFYISWVFLSFSVFFLNICSCSCFTATLSSVDLGPGFKTRADPQVQFSYHRSWDSHFLVFSHPPHSFRERGHLPPAHQIYCLHQTIHCRNLTNLKISN